MVEMMLLFGVTFRNEVCCLRFAQPTQQALSFSVHPVQLFYDLQTHNVQHKS